MPPTWTETLAEFLRSAPGVEAVRIDPVAHKISLATLGAVDEAALRHQLAATLAAIEAQLGAAVAAPAGFTLRREGGMTELAGETCPTAPKFWKWREFSWPPPEPAAAPAEPEWRQLALLAAICGVTGLAGWIVGRMTNLPPSFSLLLFSVALVAGGWDAAIDTWENLRTRKLDIHFLMLAVAVGAVCVGAWGEAVLLLFLFSSSGAMEEFALDRTHRAVDSLLKSAPKFATRMLADGGEREVPVEELKLGDRVLVRPGGAFSADGQVVKGKSASDEAALTGEAVPVEKGVGDPVFSGTLNLWGAVEFEVKRLPGEARCKKSSGSSRPRKSCARRASGSRTNSAAPTRSRCSPRAR